MKFFPERFEMKKGAVKLSTSCLDLVNCHHHMVLTSVIGGGVACSVSTLLLAEHAVLCSRSSGIMPKCYVQWKICQANLVVSAERMYVIFSRFCF